MTPRIRSLQLALGLAGLVWAALLLPRTGFILWIGANVVYGLLALAAGSLGSRGDGSHGLLLALTAFLIFVVANGGVGFLAYTAGGACLPILVVIAVIAPLQLWVLLGRRP